MFRQLIALIVVSAPFLSCFDGAAAQSTQAGDCDSAWAKVEEKPTQSNLESFVRFFSDCKQAPRARDMLAAMSPKDPDAIDRGGVRVTYHAIGHVLSHSKRLEPRGGGYGIVILRRSGPRNALACQEFTKALTFLAEPLPALEIIDGIAVYRRPIYWPVLSEHAFAGRCPEMLNDYDQERADVLARTINAPKGDGPFLAMVRADGRRVGLFDFSNVPSSDFSMQFSRFVEHMSRDSSVWSETFYETATLKQNIRRIIDENGAKASSVVATLLSFPTPAFAETGH